MRFTFTLPDVGEGIAEAEIVEYLVAVGDVVTADQNVVRISTDKAVVELPSPRSGKVVEIPKKPGDTVRVGDALLVIETESVSDRQTPDSGLRTQPTQPDASRLEPSEKETGQGGAGKTPPPPPAAAAATPAAAAARVLATPHTRKLARDLGVNIETVPPTGTHGRVTDDDVRKAAQRPATHDTRLTAPLSEARTPYPVPLAPDFVAVRRVPLKGVRKRTAEAMSKSWATIPHVTHADDADVTALLDVVARAREDFARSGVKITPLSFVVNAVVSGLRAFPALNSSLDDEKAEMVFHDFYNIGIAVDTPGGLLVPVVKDADRKPIIGIAREIQELTAKARDKTIALEEMRGGTFTITNVGPLGGTYSTPIILHPQVAILALMRAQERPVVRDGRVVVRTTMPLCVSFDHRAIDGAEAARFVNHVIRLIEDPMKLLVEG